MHARNRLFLGCALVMSLALAGIASADNVLLNPDFETGDLSDWVTGGESPTATITVMNTDNGPALPGTHCVLMDNQTEAIGLVLKQSTEVGYVGEGAVNYAFDLKLVEALNGGVMFVQIFAEQEGVGVIGGTGVMGPFWNTEWQTIASSFVAPAGTDFVTFQFTATTGAVAGSSCVCYVDNVVIDQGTVGNEDLTWSGVKTLFD